MAVRNIWTVTDTGKVVSYRMQYKTGQTISESIKNIHREIVYTFGGTPLDISLNSNNTVGCQLSVTKQRLDDEAVYDVCSELLHHRQNDGSAEFANVASMTFDWVYIQAVLQTFDGVPDLTYFTHFTDIKSKMDNIYSGARAVAELKVLDKTGNLDIINSFEEFSVWHANTVLDVLDSPHIEEDYKIIKKAADHVSLISRLPRNILDIVADKSCMNLWESDGRYIMYHEYFNDAWIGDFVNVNIEAVG